MIDLEEIGYFFLWKDKSVSGRLRKRKDVLDKTRRSGN